MSTRPNPRRLLLVDGDPNDRAFVTAILHEAFPGVSIEHAGNQEQFHLALVHGPYDAVITEHRLPWGTGIDVLRVCRDLDEHQPVIACTIGGDEDEAVAAIDAGMDNYVIKSPIRIRRLPVAVRQAMDQARFRRRHGELELRLEALLNRIDLGVYQATLDGQVLYANPAFARQLGFASPAEVRACNVHELFPADDRRAHMARLAELGVDDTDTTLLRPSGGAVPIHLTEARSWDYQHREVIDGLVRVLPAPPLKLAANGDAAPPGNDAPAAD